MCPVALTKHLIWGQTSDCRACPLIPFRTLVTRNMRHAKSSRRWVLKLAQMGGNVAELATR